MKICQALHCHITHEPRLTFPKPDQARLWVRVGINHHQRNEAGGWDDLPKTFHDLVQFGKGAERSFERLRVGDNIIALGTVRTYTTNVDGTEEKAEQFVASRIGHDLNTTDYTVQRRRSATQQRTPDRNPPATPAAAHGDRKHPPPAPPPPAEPINR
ncbi:single-stranded DNA-binding protein [Jiangella alba]|uniref:Single-stranded DNA-binding protein n=1 Tax=Jiangella alba TaxID=561176 RepID=A0A1H5J655_9ACTN|nr:single-stranded DNA-binding protein [Jiangella alba]SEE47108.1 Single-stranded DNA-binding protein [Jiangella alba]